ncbi:class I SAM-dependent methyltransferase [Desulfobacterota bacterium AH_259_B03_O07]|nr:class I SAM-dependent methyltransferase [Desulfobacterota bacterium AH_259_B03_O07]
MMRLILKLERWIGNQLASLLPQIVLRSFASRLCERDPQAVLEAFGPHLNRNPNLDNMPFDLPCRDDIQFEHLSGLFASTSLDHAVIAMTVRQAAYLFGLIRQKKVRKVIEIGRYKGGSTLLIVAAMNKKGEFWSIDIGEKEDRLHRAAFSRPFDEMLADVCKRFGLKVNIIVGDSGTVDIVTGEVDLVFIDGDHTYDGVKKDFERFGKRVRVGGSVLFDDAFDEGIFKSHSYIVGRLISEIITSGEFKLVKVVNRLAHLERVQPKL